MSGMLRFDNTGSKFKGKILFPGNVSAVHYFIPMEKGVYLLFSESEKGKKMLVYDVEQNKVLSEMYDIPSFILFNTIYHHSYSPFYVLNNQIHFVQGYNGDVYAIGKEGMELKYHWDFCKQNFSIEGLPERDIKYYTKYEQTTGSKYANTFTEYGENSHYYMVKFLYDNKVLTLLYDKLKKKAIVFDLFKEDIFCLPQFLDEKALYGFINPAWPGMQNYTDHMVKTFKQDVCIAPESNPYIIKYIFK